MNPCICDNMLAIKKHPVVGGWWWKQYTGLKVNTKKIKYNISMAENSALYKIKYNMHASSDIMWKGLIQWVYMTYDWKSYRIPIRNPTSPWKTAITDIGKYVL